MAVFLKGERCARGSDSAKERLLPSDSSILFVTTLTDEIMTLHAYSLTDVRIYSHAALITQSKPICICVSEKHRFTSSDVKLPPLWPDRLLVIQDRK